MTEFLGLAGFFLAVLTAASTGAIFQPGAWYEGLRKPPWRPPNWLFGPAWAVLYAMIATSGWLVWREVGFAGAPLAFAVFGVQLLLNGAWSAIFFGLRRMDLAFAELVLLWLAILANIIAFLPHHAGAAWLLVPYLAWVSFAGALNFTVWRMNPDASGRRVGRAPAVKVRQQ